MNNYVEYFPIFRYTLFGLVKAAGGLWPLDLGDFGEKERRE